MSPPTSTATRPSSHTSSGDPDSRTETCVAPSRSWMRAASDRPSPSKSPDTDCGSDSATNGANARLSAFGHRRADVTNARVTAETATKVRTVRKDMDYSDAAPIASQYRKRGLRDLAIFRLSANTAARDRVLGRRRGPI